MAVLKDDSTTPTPLLLGGKTVNWDEINRGKVRSLFVEAILSNPNVTTDLKSVNVDQIKQVVEPLIHYVFGD